MDNPTPCPEWLDEARFRLEELRQAAAQRRSAAATFVQVLNEQSKRRQAAERELLNLEGATGEAAERARERLRLDIEHAARTVERALARREEAMHAAERPAALADAAARLLATLGIIGWDEV